MYLLFWDVNQSSLVVI